MPNHSRIAIFPAVRSGAHYTMIEIKPMRIESVRGEAARQLYDQFDKLAPHILSAYAMRALGDAGESAPPHLVQTLRELFATCVRLDTEYGVAGPLPVEDAAEFADAALHCLADLRAWLPRLGIVNHEVAMDKVLLGVAVWALSHEIELSLPDPLVNALAHAANDAASKQDLAAIYGIMQGIIDAAPETMKSDLEKSNPYRPWRILLLNFAIVAIRTQDIPMMLYAFGMLERYLPEECSGFFAETVIQSQHSAFSDAVRGLLNAELAKWTLRH
jgi:hypothetical protein